MILNIHRQPKEIFGVGDGQFWLDDVVCDGNEESLADCGHREWGKHNCRAHHTAGVVCVPQEHERKDVPRPSEASGEV